MATTREWHRASAARTRSRSRSRTPPTAKSGGGTAPPRPDDKANQGRISEVDEEEQQIGPPPESPKDQQQQQLLEKARGTEVSRASIGRILLPVTVVAVDAICDGLLTGLTANVDLTSGIVIAVSLAIEMTFTGGALAGILLRRQANRKLSIMILAVVPLLLFAGAFSGNAIMGVLDE